MKPAIAILQARMSSTRLPGKVLKPILGKPMLSYQIERLKHCKFVSQIILATTVDPSDAPLVEFAKQQGLTCFRGSLNDVLDRYYGAAKLASDKNAPYLMRVTGDCPLLDPEICDAVVEEIQNQQADYCASSDYFADGLDCEVFTAKALELAWQKASLASEREHVTILIRNNPELFKCCEYTQELNEGHIRITVDEVADFELVQEIIKALYQEGKTPFSFAAIRNFLEQNPALMATNATIIRNEGLIKSLAEDHKI